MSDEKLYVIPSASMSRIREELADLKNTSSFLLKYFVEDREVNTWDSSPIPELCELYCGSASVGSLLDTVSEEYIDIPQQYKDSIGVGDVVLRNSDYVAMLTLIESLRTIKKTASMNYGISFEVH